MDYFDGNDSFDEFLSQNEGNSELDLQASDNAGNVEIQQMLKNLKKASEEDKEMVENVVQGQTEPPTKRFKSISEEELKSFASAAQSTNTKKNTQWGLRIFQEWSNEVYGGPIDLKCIAPEDLASKLTKFYCEATPKNMKKRSEEMKEQHAEIYHKNTMINIRAAINRHLHDIDRDIDIVRDKMFKSANKTLDGLLKVRTVTGASKPTQHKAIIPECDMKKIKTYFEGALTSPYILRQAVWFNLAIHFVSRGLEFHKQLHRNSFDFKQDENGKYVSLNHLTHQKNHTGGLSKSEDENTFHRRMYAVEAAGEYCPVALLRLFIEKTDQLAEMLFNQYRKNAQPCDDIWFTAKPLSPRTFCTFMPDICKSIGIKKYTAHCLRATAITAMNDSGHEARHIMFMSGHKSEAAIRSYNRTCSDEQKKSLSSTLSNLAAGETNNNSTMSLVPRPRGYLTPITTCTITRPTENINTNLSAAYNSGHNQASIMSSFTSSGMLTNSVFHNCSFNFHSNKAEA